MNDTKWDVNYRQKLGPNGYDNYEILNEEGLVVFEGAVDDGVIPIKEKLQMIKLAATAPELLEMLIEVKSFLEKETYHSCGCSYEGQCNLCSKIQKIEEIINKARGEANDTA